MLCLLAFCALLSQEVERTPAVYRCPAAEAETDRMKTFIDESGFDSVCIDPKPGPKARAWIKGKLKTVSPSAVDTKANLRWRNATIAFTMGKISPAEWLSRTRNLHETVHFLTSPKTKELREEMAVVPVDPGGTFSARSVFSELFLLSLPGKPCLYASDIWRTRDLPDAGRLQSWVLAMNDWLGPMLSLRHDHPSWVANKPQILRADKKPGMLIYRQTAGSRTWTFYVNNSSGPLELPSLRLEYVTINRGLNLDGEKPFLMDAGFVIEHSEEPSQVSGLY